MRVHVTWFPRGSGTERSVELAATASVADLLESLDVTPDGVLVVRNDAPIPLDTGLDDGDTLRIVRTVSGG